MCVICLKRDDKQFSDQSVQISKKDLMFGIFFSLYVEVREMSVLGYQGSSAETLLVMI